MEEVKPLKLIDRDKLLEDVRILSRGQWIRDAIMAQPVIEAVPMDYHDKCMDIEIRKRFELERQMERVFCITCDCDREYTLCNQEVEMTVRGVRFTFIELQAICIECGDEIYVPWVHDRNMKERKKAFAEARRNNELQRNN